MDIRIEGRNLEVNERLRHHVERKLGQLERHLLAASEAVVELSSEPTRVQQQKVLCQISLHVNGAVLRAECRGINSLVAVTGAVARLDQAVSRYKGHAYRSQRSRNYLSIGEQQANEILDADRELALEVAPEGTQFD